PGLLRRQAPRFRTPYALLGLVGFGAMLFCLLGDLELVARMGSLCALWAMSMVVLGDAIRMRSRGENEAEGFRLPMAPLFPALALVVCLFLVPTMGIRPIVACGVWLLGGLVFYLGYVKEKYVEGQEGVVVFKKKREEREAEYRVLVPLGPGERQTELIKLAVALADQEGGEVLPLRVVTIPAQLALREGARMAEGVESVFSWSLSAEDTGQVLLTPTTRVARSVSQGILDTATEEKCDLLVLSWEGHSGTKGGVLGSVLDPVVQSAPCDVLLVKDGAVSEPDSILLPTRGGTHAAMAARLAVKLARWRGAKVTVLYVSREGAPAEEREDAMELIERTVEGLEADDLIVPKVITAPGVVGAILKEATKHSLMILGASEEGLFGRVLFGTIPERIARKSESPVMIAKQHAPLPQFWVKRLWNAVYRAFPTLEAEERSTVYQQIRESARADIDFFVMITLSATIATLGLLLNSAAVIIGGMLVAPLMSPIIGIAMAIALGNARLLRDGVESTIKGIFLAVLVALLLARILPIGNTTEEILARTTPNLLDLVIALASGAAGAYAVSRKDVSAALPGVAIAAALVPPLGVVGIGLAGGQLAVAGGGLLLFGTNLVGITLAGTVSLLLLGFRPVGEARERESRIRRWLVVSIVLLLVVSLPLGLLSGRAIQASQEEEVVSRVLVVELAEIEGVSLVHFEVQRQAETLGVTVTAYVSEEVQEGLAEDLAAALGRELDREVRLRLISIPVSETTVP
ncbi:MAG TPA: TIGR00341 family protein, partial [Chloroflexi bacterium]|nr:TIGR00341 family protein [Chloroflexota bacterium]